MSEDARVATITRGLLKGRTADEAALAAAALLDLERELAEWEERWHAIESKVLLHDDAIARAETAEARLAEVTAERDEWKVEADRRGWPKEAAQEYHRMKVDLPRAEAQLAVAREALLAARHELGFVTQLPADAAVKAHAIVDTALAQLDGEQRG